MRRISLIAVLALVLTACSGTQLTNLKNGLANFNSAVAAVNDAIAQDSPQLAASCNTLHGIGVSLAAITSGGTQRDLDSINAGILTYCQKSEDDGTIADAIDSVTSAIASGRTAYRNATGKSL